MRFVAMRDRFVALDRPACLGVAAFAPDGRFLRRLDEGGIDQCAAFDQKPGGFDLREYGSKERRGQAGL